MKKSTTLIRILHTAVPLAAAAFCIGGLATKCCAQDLFRKRLAGDSAFGAEATRFEVEPKGVKGVKGTDIPTWLQAMDSFQPYPTTLNYSHYDEDERSDLAKQATVRMLGNQLEKIVRNSPLADAYQYMAKAADRSKNLLTLSETVDKGSDSSKSSVSGKKNRISLGLDPIRAFSPTLSLGNNARVVSDVRKGDITFEWRYGF